MYYYIDRKVVLNVKIKELRERKEMSQAELAKMLNLSPSTIGMYEQGRRQPNHETLEKLADFFHVSTDYLLGREESPRKYMTQMLLDDVGEHISPERLALIQMIKRIPQDKLQAATEFLLYLANQAEIRAEKAS